MTPSRYPGIIMAVLQYPAIIFMLVAAAYMFFTPIPMINRDKLQLVAKYACTHNNPPDWCDELASDLAHGRRVRASLLNDPGTIKPPFKSTKEKP